MDNLLSEAKKLDDPLARIIASMKATMANPLLSAEEKHAALGANRILIKGRKAELDTLLRNNEAQLQDTQLQLDALNDINVWLKGCNEYPRIEKPDGSVFHKLQSSVFDGRLIMLDEADDDQVLWPTPPFPDFTSFVVEHDWAAAFANASDFAEGDFKLPFELSCFEFRYSGKRVCALVSDTDAGRMMHPMLMTRVGWLMPPTAFLCKNSEWLPARPLKISPYKWLANELGRQIRALCIGLDAEVAVHEIVRAPHRLNAQRIKSGKLPLVDYHIVSLAHRSRAAALDAGAPSGKHHRLHFVRGHWRHYPTHKTWIKWHLRGDPDLGFIDKHYRL